MRKREDTLSVIAVTAAITSVIWYGAWTVERKKRNLYELRRQQHELDVRSTGAPKLPSQPAHTVKCEDITIKDVYLLEIPSLDATFESKLHDNRKICEDSNAAYTNIIDNRDVVLADIVRKHDVAPVCRAYVRAGPRRFCHFEPHEVNAAIVTCGGLCPGLNTVIREITNTLFLMYGVKKVYGLRGGFKGFLAPPVDLTPDVVANIHHQGGTMLASSRGGFQLDPVIDFIKKRNISQLYIIGGDGTHRGAFSVSQECLRLGLNVSVVGVPKTIDNDLSLIDRSFGFETAVEAAQAAISAAKTEAMCNMPNGVGIVKLMGRSTGFIAAYATMSSGDVDLCLVPESPIVLEGEFGCLPHLEKRVARKGHAVVVVAEGAGQELLGKCAETDLSGNPKLPPIGEFLKDKITEYFASRNNPATVKYIDPSYMIRSVPPNSADSRYCMQVGQNAVHGAMAGFTGFSVGLCNNRVVFIPIPVLVESSPRGMRRDGRTWERVLSITRQPDPPLEMK
eukprot:c278_g1_i1.p1 GENE.c278_g1_i1~~c278_g1_i1.p1  ORF type:complete len:508 (+),score=115.94 c278_g1_i1:240-1763(+)